MEFKLIEYSLGDLLNIKYGKNQKKVVDEKGQYPILGTGGIMGYANDFLYDQPSVLIGRKGSISRVHYIEEPFWTVDTLFYTEVNEHIVFPRYLYYVLSQIDFNYYNEGTTIPSLRTETLNKIRVSIPSKLNQQNILDAIVPIEEKIKKNEGIIDNLEQLAQMLFKRWFIDFEFPNENGEPYKSNGGEMVESELGMIPVGWRVELLKSIASVGSGKRPKIKKDSISNETPIPILGASKVMGYTNKELFNEPILVTGRVGTHGVLQRFSKPCWPSDNTLVLKSAFLEFVYQFMQTINYTSLNKGSTQPLITQSDIKSLKVTLPPNELLKMFEIENAKITKLVTNSRTENDVLSNLRDTLLPKLLSGEIELPNETEVTEDVPIS